MLKNKLLTIITSILIVSFILMFTACFLSGALGGSDGGGNGESTTTYTIVITMVGNVPGDSIIATPNTGVAGTKITLQYMVEDLAPYNMIDFKGVFIPIEQVIGAGSGTRGYTINPADASGGVITIIATFEHVSVAVKEYTFEGGTLLSPQGQVYPGLIRPDSVIDLKLRNPLNYEILTYLEYQKDSSWIPFSRYEAPGDYSYVENTSSDFHGTTITVKYNPTEQIRMTTNNAEIGQSYRLRLRLNDKETMQVFNPYELPVLTCTDYPAPVDFMMVRAGAGANGVVVDWQQLLRSGTTTGDLADADRMVISCSDLVISQTYTRELNQVTSIWGPWFPAGINETGSPFFSIALGAGTPLVEGRSYNVVLRFSNEAGVAREISEPITSAVMDARIVRGGVVDEYESLQEAFNSMDVHDENVATIIVLRSIVDQAPITISGNKTITLESQGSNIIQLGASHVGSSLFTVHSGLNLKLGGASSGALTLKGLDPNTTALISVNIGGTLTLNANAVITGNKNNSSNGGGVYCVGNFIMDGGSIEGNSALSGSGVYVNGTFTLNEGRIQNNTATGSGGGIYVANGNLNLGNGIIQGNSATTGGGVYVSSGTFNMSGGNITGNSATTNNSASLYVATGGTAVYSGYYASYGTNIVSVPGGTDSDLP